MTPQAPYAEALTHLGDRCEVMAGLIGIHRPPGFAPVEPEKYFDVLVCSIVGQQLSVRAADTIEARLRALVGPLTPERILDAREEDLRALGFSRSKVAYSHGLAEAFLNNTITPHLLTDAPDETVVSTLTAVKGIGPWTAEMFMMFGLGRLDVWSQGDLGLRRSMEHFFGEATPAIAERWRPYRSVAAWYLWEHSDQLQGRIIPPAD
ncbi:DNA 3-methyladenine glycosylase II [Pontimonas salivibrio]|uniref:DNA-3-methyladenine glycosylase II n=1 Tax=Pontimonas salivibrio TaxID=1159327 RepID=A0A2L2BNL1_9MICO|nr:DNA-3-methyladenine glycosylase [Pontimonas salivibrio]AVG23260.1 DNA 3-methyladenine glycosylase II [Pontimonas salivibrio]